MSALLDRTATQPNEIGNSPGMVAASRPHRRHNPLADEWALVSPQRGNRPRRGAMEVPLHPGTPDHDLHCHLCTTGPLRTQAVAGEAPATCNSERHDLAMSCLDPDGVRAATDGAHWRLHAHSYPPLLRSASIRTFMVGYEVPGEAQRDPTPEPAAAALRTTSDFHYLTTAWRP